MVSDRPGDMSLGEENAGVVVREVTPTEAEITTTVALSGTVVGL